MEKVKEKTKFMFVDSEGRVNEITGIADKIGCPFCGKDDIRMINFLTGYRYAVQCRNCKATGPIGKNGNKALEYWEVGVYSEIGIIREERYNKNGMKISKRKRGK